MRHSLPLLAVLLLAADWPQFRGPNRDGHSPEAGWLAAWPEKAGPKVAWSARVGKGHAGVSVAAGRAYTAGWDGKQDAVWCLDAVTGKEIWKRSYPCRDLAQWPGPRATPTVAAGRVFTLSQHGDLFAWDAATGKQLWEKKLPRELEPDGDYGFAWSPLVVGERLILPGGEAGLAVHVADGSWAWGYPEGGKGLVAAACASPVPFVWDGKPAAAVVVMGPNRDSVRVVGVLAETGKEVWRSPAWEEKWGAVCSDVVVADGAVFVASAEQHLRCGRFPLKAGPLAADWTTNKLPVYTGGLVHVGGHLYGVTKAGLLKCLDAKTGQEKWSQRGFGEYGTLIAADGRLIVQASEGGEVVVVAATPAAYREERRSRVLAEGSRTFTAPTLANGRLYCRGYDGEVVCLDLAGR